MIAVHFCKASADVCMYKIIALLGFNPTHIAGLSPKLRDNLSVPSTRVKQSKVGRPETSAINHQYMLRKTTEDTMSAWNPY